MVAILGVEFTAKTQAQVVADCVGFIESKTPHVVITAGPEFVMGLRRHPELLAITQHADLITPDGIGVVMAARWRGQVLPERVTGVELAEQLLKAAAEHGWRVYVLGATEASLQGALVTLRVRYPQLTVAGRSGYFSAAEEPQVVADIRAYEPHLLFVALGQPRQEVLIDKYRDVWQVPLAMGVGGTIDIWSGTAKRAPVWAQRLKVEWLYRLLREPKRLRRQLVLPQFAWAAWREGLMQRGR